MFIHLQQRSINSTLIVDIDWGSDEVAVEPSVEGATELSNPNAGATSPKVAVVRYAVQLNDSPLALVIDRSSEDFQTLKQAVGKR